MRRRVAAGLLLWLVAAGGLRVTLLAAESCPPVTAAEVDAAVDNAVGWFDANAAPGGRWRYAVSDDGDVLPGYSTVRHAGVLLALYQAGAPDVAAPGLAWAEDHLVDHADWSALVERPSAPVPVGATALLVAALVERDVAADDRLLRRLGRFLAVMQRPDGSVLATWDPTTGRPVPDGTSPFFTGEAMWALARLEQRFPGEGWGAASRRTLHYLATERDDAEGRYPLTPDHWGAYGLEATPSLGSDELAWARRLAGAFGVRVRFESQQRERGLVGVVRGGFSMASAVGTLGEGLGGLWRLADREAALADLRPTLRHRLSCAAGVLVERQADDGAWYADGVTRMDDQQHAISALLLARPAVAG
ncbi:MAG: hypothetical protein ACRDJP_16780 [Actinomycetota bacterium]